MWVKNHKHEATLSIYFNEMILEKAFITDITGLECDEVFKDQGRWKFEDVLQQARVTSTGLSAGLRRKRPERLHFA